MTKRYVVVGADRSGNSWDIYETDSLREAFAALMCERDSQGIWDASRDRWASAEDIEEREQ